MTPPAPERNAAYRQHRSLRCLNAVSLVDTAMQKQSDANGEPLGSPLRFIPNTRIYAASRTALKFRILASSGQARDSPAFVQKGSAMKEKAFKSAGLAGLCQGVSPDDEPCGNPATFHCLK